MKAEITIMSYCQITRSISLSRHRLVHRLRPEPGTLPHTAVCRLLSVSAESRYPAPAQSCAART